MLYLIGQEFSDSNLWVKLPSPWCESNIETTAFLKGSNLLWVNKCCIVSNLMHKHREKYLVHPPSALLSFRVTLEAVTIATQTCPKVTGQSWALSWTLKQAISLATQNQVSWSCDNQALGTDTDTKALFFFYLSWHKLNKYKHTSMQAGETCKTLYNHTYCIVSHKPTTETLAQEATQNTHEMKTQIEQPERRWLTESLTYY